jgi:HlyD family secretion protein
VTEIANSASNLTGNSALANTDQVTEFIVKIRVDPSSYKELVNKSNKYPLRPGMSASVDIFTNKREGIISVPIQSVTVREKDGLKKDAEKLTDEDYEEVVFVVKGDTIAKQKVVTGIQDDESIEIISGLDTSMTVVSGPYNDIAKNLKSGERVRKKEEKKDKDKGKKK